ncbi:MAG: chromosome segregation ATPase, partial [Pseudohongiellaceae bacterium]
MIDPYGRSPSTAASPVSRPCRQARAVLLALGLLGMIFALPGCLVTRTAPSLSTNAGDETLLKRANAALLQRIQVEKEHVDYYNRELSSLLVEERRLNAEFVQKEAEYQLLASDRDGQIQEAADAQLEYQEALNNKVTVQGRLVDVRGEAEALQRERAALEAALLENRAAIEEGQVRLQASNGRLEEISLGESQVLIELELSQLLLDSSTAELLAVQSEISLLKRSFLESQGVRQWLQSSLMARLFTTSLGRDGSRLDGSAMGASGEVLEGKTAHPALDAVALDEGALKGDLGQGAARLPQADEPAGQG